MVTKNQLRLVASLQQKKYRTQHGLFVMEGKKAVNELLNSGFQLYGLYVDDVNSVADFDDAMVVSKSELKQISSLSTPNGILGVFKIPKDEQVNFSDWVVTLDAVRDPGNLGTIIRLCDWFGMKHLVCSLDTVDCYNPKVLQATMGSIARVNVVYRDLEEFLLVSPSPSFGTFMNGKSVYKTELPKCGVLIMGNEANGISAEIEKLVSERISIPQYGPDTTESLNAATATAIFLNEIRRGQS